jgi:hypothetical protein
LLQTKDSYRLALEALIQHVVRLNLYASSAAPFYIYVCLSSEIRRMALDLILCRRINNNLVGTTETKNQANCPATIETYKMKIITLSQMKPNEK